MVSRYQADIGHDAQKWKVYKCNEQKLMVGYQQELIIKQHVIHFEGHILVGKINWCQSCRKGYVQQLEGHKNCTPKNWISQQCLILSNVTITLDIAY